MERSDSMTQEPRSLDSLAAALSAALGIDPPRMAAPANETLVSYVKSVFKNAPADRVFMYNPDAVARWLTVKYPAFFTEARDAAPCEVPLTSVMPSVTPVCFGTMYTGAQPEVHGIRAYEKPVITIDTLFDALIRAGKRPAIVAEKEHCSMSRIFLNREMDYYFFDTMQEVNAKAAELILEDCHDFIAVYNGNYDTVMHKNGTEHPLSLGELRANVLTFADFAALIRRRWTSHNTLIGFAMDHGAHDIDGGCGSHGLAMPEDLEITHLYGAIPRTK